VITQQPVDTFYKDEGGKSNFLKATVALSDKHSSRLAVPLSFKLYFECGRCVPEQDQRIMSLLDFKYETAVVTHNKPCVVRFRLEKVSRRMDNQRFKLQVSSADPDISIAPVFTSAVTVLSKRKTGERFVVRRNPSPQQRMKEFTKSLQKIVGELTSKVDALQDALSINTRLLEAQNARMTHMEQLLLEAQPAGRVAAPATEDPLDVFADLSGDLPDFAVPPLVRADTSELIEGAALASMSFQPMTKGIKRVSPGDFNSWYTSEQAATEPPAGADDPAVVSTRVKYMAQRRHGIRRWVSMEAISYKPPTSDAIPRATNPRAKKRQRC